MPALEFKNRVNSIIVSLLGPHHEPKVYKCSSENKLKLSRLVIFTIDYIVVLHKISVFDFKKAGLLVKKWNVVFTIHRVMHALQ